MVVLNKIYTKTGDDGETALGNGARVAKHSMRVTAYGTTDELNSIVGHRPPARRGRWSAQLALIQNDLFDLGADLCLPDMERDSEAGYPVLRMIDSQMDRLEREIDAMNARLKPLRSFILPAGLGAVRPSAPVPHRRAACRAACGLPRTTMELVNPSAVKYLNRLATGSSSPPASPTTTATRTSCGFPEQTAESGETSSGRSGHGRANR